MFSDQSLYCVVWYFPITVVSPATLWHAGGCLNLLLRAFESLIRDCNVSRRFHAPASFPSSLLAPP